MRRELSLLSLVTCLAILFTLTTFGAAFASSSSTSHQVSPQVNITGTWAFTGWQRSKNRSGLAWNWSTNYN